VGEAGRVTTTTPVTPAPRTRSAGGAARAVLRVVGELMITVGVLLLLLVAYQLWWTNVEADRAAEGVREEIVTQWAADPDPRPGPPAPVEEPSYGTGFALMYIPRLSDSVWGTPVIEGVGLDVLATGIGHYPETAMPGEIGNFAVAAHRATNGEPFKDIDRLREGDRVVVETRNGWYVYELERDQIVLPTDTWVIDPVPGKPGETPTEALITLTTCNPRWGSTERWIWWGTLVEERGREQGPPPEMRERG
jgi:sortase A